ncbi:hypothetical protein ACOQFO_09280 [Ureibacillus sp. MALMAid1270]|uniref:hypothetical protein n=1 Tax=Ureibacillus sp. MALMAid1270 TaxID=3411629 RepID=UPI003BA6A566
MRRLLILLTAIGITLFGCSQVQKTQTVSTSSTLHNYDSEMITEALKNHTDFPKLTINETSITEEVQNGGNTIKVTYSWKTDINSDGSTVTIDKEKEDNEVWTEASSADYFITLTKESETDKGNVMSYWKYQYFPQANEIQLVESEDYD